MEVRHDIILQRLFEAYPNAKCELNYSTPFELLVAVILSAQCTDKRVNEVTPVLFKALPNLGDIANAKPEELEKLIFSCGFYHNKARNIIAAARDILIIFRGKVPNKREDLMSLRGVGRKTANVVLNTAFGKDAIAVDTHVFRVSRRLGLSKGKTPGEVEKDLNKKYLGKKGGRDAHKLLVFHGRYCCHSKKPNCQGCKVNDLCGFEDKTKG